MDMTNIFGNASTDESDYEFGVGGSDNYPDQDLYDHSNGSTTQSSASPTDFQNVTQFFPEYVAGQMYSGIKDDNVAASPDFDNMYQQPPQSVILQAQAMQHIQPLQQTRNVSVSQQVPSLMQVPQGQQEQSQLQMSPQLHQMSPQLQMNPQLQAQIQSQLHSQLQLSPQQMLVAGIKEEHQRQSMEEVPAATESMVSSASPNAKTPTKRKRENRYKNAPPSVLSRRRAQNRASQRAYRERKDQRIKDLEYMLSDAQAALAEVSRRHEDLKHVFGVVSADCDRLRRLCGQVPPHTPGNSTAAPIPFTMPSTSEANMANYNASMTAAAFGIPSPDQVEYTMYPCHA